MDLIDFVIDRKDCWKISVNEVTAELACCEHYNEAMMLLKVFEKNLDMTMIELIKHGSEYNVWKPFVEKRLRTLDY